MTRPLIAVSAAIELLPTPFGDVDCTKLTTAYTNAVYAVGGRPVLMPVVTDPPDDMLAGFDGLLLSGGGDLDPRLYGEERDPSVYGVRPDRDAFEIALYREAVGRGIPILAICRGMQLINILRGGSLLQQITKDPRHWQDGSPSAPNHEVIVTPGSVLADVVGGAIEVQVNSYHHQCIRKLGVGLRITAVCIDVIEAVEAQDADIVAVQWHPEQMVATDHLQRALFESLVGRAAAAQRNRHREEMTL